MRRALLIAVVASACASSPTTTQPPAAQLRTLQPAPDASARVVFDGATLAGWDGDPRFWRVEQGCIVGESTPERPCGDSTYLVWRGGEVRDFELAFEFRIHGGNSGLQFRSRDAGKWKVAGYQADIEDGPNWTGCLYEQDGRGVVATRGEQVSLGPGSREALALEDPAALLALVRKNDWNHYVVRARGERIELELNGRRMVEVVDRDATRRALSGLLALQLHAGAPMKVEFRDFRLVDFEPEPLPAGPTRATQVEAGATPQWIWASAESPQGDLAVFERRFVLDRAPKSATLRTSADNHSRVFLNGALVVETHDWAAPIELDVSEGVRLGENVVAMAARNDGGPAAAWVELVIDGEAGRLLRVVSDASWGSERPAPTSSFETWTPAEFQATRASIAHVVAPLGGGVWGAVLSTAAPVEVTESALRAEELVLLDGFRAELLYSVPKGEQGSWVSMCEDPHGRLYVSDQYGGLYRVTVGATASDTRVEKVAIELGCAHGLCWAYDSLYVVVSDLGEDKNGLWRVRDTDGDDRLDAAELLRKLQGGGEHGPHAVVLGPDGKLWIVGGNHTKLPEPIDSYRLPPTWGEDVLLPRIDDPNGHAVGIMAPGGWVVRTDSEGKSWELWAAGLRNAYDIAFDTEGELFTFDSDMEWDVGLPWYRPTRILHVTSGADFGWRNGSGKWPADYPDTLPRVVDIGLSSPTGVVFGTNAKFPPQYQRALFALDWAYGTIHAVHLEPQGASYTGTFEKFATGKPFPVTDVVIGRDGAMYVTTGGRRTQSGLYRITWTEKIEPDDYPYEIAPDGRHLPGYRARSDREWFEGSHALPLREADPTSWDVARDELAQAACRALDSGDPFLRHAGRSALERLEPRYWVASYAREPLSRGDEATVAVLIAMLHRDPLGQRDRVVEALLGTHARPASVLGLLRVVGLLLTRCPTVDEATREKLRRNLETLYPMSDPRLDRELLQVLVALDSPTVVEPAIAVLESDAAQEERIWAAYCLRVAKSGWTVELRERFFTALDDLRRTAKGGHSLAKYLDVIREQAVAGLSNEERSALGDLVAPAPVVTSAASAPAATFVRSWTRDELMELLREPLTGRSSDAGALAFAKARCAECHRFAGEGGSTGPDLTGAGSRFSRSDLLDAILEPSKTISDQYQDTEIVTTDGDLYVGRLAGEADGVVALHRLPPQDDVVEFDASEIASRRLHPMSRMPSALLDVLSADEIRDLVAYLLAQ